MFKLLLLYFCAYLFKLYLLTANPDKCAACCVVIVVLLFYPIAASDKRNPKRDAVVVVVVIIQSAVIGIFSRTLSQFHMHIHIYSSSLDLIRFSTIFFMPFFLQLSDFSCCLLRFIACFTLYSSSTSSLWF